MNNNPLVSVICLTYNEEEFVSEMLDNILLQKTNFSYEVLVYDDASNDATPNILKEYAKKSNFITITLYKENNFRKGLGFFGLREGFREARGKYIAYCEGDDYWCDNYKLQKQVDFLETHPKYAVCAHETVLRNDYYKHLDGLLFSHMNVNLFIDRRNRRKYTFSDTLTGNIFHISSLMFRNDKPIMWPEWIHKITACDMVLFMLLAERGDIYVLPDVMSVYRYRKNSITTTPEGDFKNSISFYEASVDILRRINIYWDRVYQKQIFPIIARYYMRSMFVCLSKSYRHPCLALKMWQKALKYDKFVALKYLMIEMNGKLCRWVKVLCIGVKFYDKKNKEGN